MHRHIVVLQPNMAGGFYTAPEQKAASL